MQALIHAQWDAVIERIHERVPLFREVRAMPLQVIRRQEFYEHFPGLQTPACLLVFMGQRRAAHGQVVDVEGSWSAVIVARDPAGDAYEEAVSRADEFCQRVLDTQIDVPAMGEQRLTLNASADIDSVPCSPDHAVYEIAFTTRHYEDRNAEDE